MLSSKSRRAAAVAGVAAAAVATSLVAAGSASAQQRNFYVAKVVSNKFVGPLQFTVGPKNVYVTDSFTSKLVSVAGNRTLFTGPGQEPGAQESGDVSGVATGPNGTLGFAYSDAHHKANKFAVMSHGKLVYLADMSQYERAHNPDGTTHYGTPSRSQCVANALHQAHMPVRYTGIKDSHPYAVAYLGGTKWVVADAGMNALIKVDTATGAVSTLAVLPRQPFVVSPAFAKQNHLPKCTVGITYYTESVPTDVEYANGKIYASTLPGGANPYGRGRVYTVDPNTGALTIIGKNFADATNIAVSPSGRVWVAELSRGIIARLVNGKPAPVYRLQGVVGLEYGHGSLYASTAPALFGAQKPGEILRLGTR